MKKVPLSTFFICTTCRKHLSSSAPMGQHLAGKLHKKRMALMRFQQTAPFAHLL